MSEERGRAHRVVQGLVGRREGLGFHPEGGGSSAGLCTEDGGTCPRCSRAPSGGCFREDSLGEHGRGDCTGSGESRGKEWAHYG